MSKPDATYLVTGAMGCIGAWVLAHLVHQGKRAVSFDLSSDRHRLDLLLDVKEQQQVTFVNGDLTQAAQLLEVCQGQRITHIIHLAALQVPFCKANPTLGAQVNVVGTVNVFEAARQAGLRHLAYASSVAVYGPPPPAASNQVLSSAPLQPATLYGVTKLANEGMARVYWQDYQLSSIALRPYTVYGVGRDQGFTSGPTQAMLAAAAGQASHIPFFGPCQYHFASDVALQFIAAAETPLEGAFVFDMGGEPVNSAQLIAEIQSARPGAQITCADSPLPFPAGLAGSAWREAFPQFSPTPLSEGIRQTITQFRTLLESGRKLL